MQQRQVTYDLPPASGESNEEQRRREDIHEKREQRCIRALDAVAAACYSALCYSATRRSATVLGALLLSALLLGALPLVALLFVSALVVTACGWRIYP